MFAVAVFEGFVVVERIHVVVVAVVVEHIPFGFVDFVVVQIQAEFVVVVLEVFVVAASVILVEASVIFVVVAVE